MWIELLESALIFLFSHVGFARPHLTPTSPSPHPHLTPCLLLPGFSRPLMKGWGPPEPASALHFIFELSSGPVSPWSALALSACVSHVRLQPSRPFAHLSVCLCVCVWLLAQCFWEDGVFYPLWLWYQCVHLSAPNLNKQPTHPPTQSRNTKVLLWFCTIWIFFLCFFFFFWF